MNRRESLRHIVEHEGGCMASPGCAECFFRKEDGSDDLLLYCGYRGDTDLDELALHERAGDRHRLAAAKEELKGLE